MTLILGMSKPEGIYLSVDYRVTNQKTHELIDDESVKFLTAHYPPPQIGLTALFAYTGIAQLRDGTPVGDWLRETLRGHAETFPESMQHLRERLNRDLARYLAHFKEPLYINTLVTAQNRRFFGGLSNVTTSGVADQFGYTMCELTNAFMFTNGSAAVRVQAEGHLDILERHLDVRPRRVHDHMKLLATVNRCVDDADDRASKRKFGDDAFGAVSPYCHVGFINGDDQNKPAYETFTKHGESVPFRMRHELWVGID